MLDGYLALRALVCMVIGTAYSIERTCSMVREHILYALLDVDLPCPPLSVLLCMVIGERTCSMVREHILY